MGAQDDEIENHQHHQDIGRHVCHPSPPVRGDLDRHATHPTPEIDAHPVFRDRQKNPSDRSVTSQMDRWIYIFFIVPSTVHLCLDPKKKKERILTHDQYAKSMLADRTLVPPSSETLSRSDAPSSESPRLRSSRKEVVGEERGDLKPAEAIELE